MKPVSFWEEERLTLERAMALSTESLRHYLSHYRHVVCAFSGGKDSFTTVTLLATLLHTGSIPVPETLTVLYADTRLELPPLQASALAALQQFEALGMQTQVVLPWLDDRFFVYMLGRGVPPPKNRFRWCTPQLKVEPMERAVAALSVRLGLGEMVWHEKKQHEVYQAYGKEKALMLTGVRVGESAARDQRIALSCTKDGAECGQGYFQYASAEGLYDTLAPIEMWRVCHVWDWLFFHAPQQGFSTQMIAEVYGGDEAEERHARTGCIECNLAHKDIALDNLLKLPQWRYLAPTKRLKSLYAWLKSPQNRLRKDGTDRRKDGALAANPMRLGPLTMEARQHGLREVLAIQDEINSVARQENRPCISLINEEEHARILELITCNTWPMGWAGTEQRGDLLTHQVVADGVVQPLLIDDFSEEASA
jgi:DNA sulfur modification protein DndC